MNKPETIYETDALIAEDIDSYLEQHQHKSMLRFITCGSVDDGKSTLIGRLLYDSKMIFEDQLSSLVQTPHERSELIQRRVQGVHSSAISSGSSFVACTIRRPMFGRSVLAVSTAHEQPSGWCVGARWS